MSQTTTAQARASDMGIAVRSILYNVLFYLNIIVLALLFLPVLVMPRQATMWLARTWGRVSLWLLKVVCGTHLEFRGLENIPAGAALIAPKHQSFLETFALLQHVPDFAYVLKRELTWIPLFGWLLMSARQLGINRSAGRSALQQVIAGAQRCFARGQSVFIFPEGTRRPVDAPAAYKGGVGFIYAESDVPCVPVALNTGLFWPRRDFHRYPGRCVIEFLPPIAPGLSRQAFMSALEERLETATRRLVEEGRATRA